jgi:hypothetical protein
VKNSFEMNPSSVTVLAIGKSIPFAGSLSAAIGLVLDYAAVSVGDSPIEPLNDECLDIDILWSIQGCGFNKKNVLLWTLNFKGFSSLTPGDFTGIVEDSMCGGLHRELLQQFSTKIVLLCGPRVER